MQQYSGWSLEKLKKERIKIDKAIAIAEKRDKKATIAKMAQLAKQNGFELHELLGEASVKKSTASKSGASPKVRKVRGKVAPKYQHPDNPSQTWTGRGRKPLWVAEHLKTGATLEQLSIATTAESS